MHDDGKGFDEALLPRQAAAGHYGVPGMRERAALMGGTLTVWSQGRRRHGRGAPHPGAERVCEYARAGLALASVRA